MQHKCIWGRGSPTPSRGGKGKVIHSIPGSMGRISEEGASQQSLEGRQLTVPTIGSLFPGSHSYLHLEKPEQALEEVELWAKVESNKHSTQGFHDLPQMYTTSLMPCMYQVFHPYWVTHHSPNTAHILLSLFKHFYYCF